ncbi:MAG: cytochrome P450 [Acidimicrobiales bacterium]
MQTLMDPAICADPHALYRDLRRDAPVMRTGNMVVVSRREEAESVFKQPNLYSSAMEATSLGNVRPLIPLQIDPPDHIRYRRILDPLFAPRRMAVLETRLTELVSNLIARFKDRGHCDLVQEFTVPFPSEVFLTMFGLPLDDLPIFLTMKDGIVRPPGSTRSEQAAHRRATGSSIYTYFERVLEDRELDERARDERGGAPGDDLISLFLTPAEDGSRLSHDEILDICYLMLVAGLDTVSASLECMFAHLAQHPDDRRLLATDAGAAAGAVEELLRWETPVMGVARLATAETELGGQPVHAGDQVSVLLGATNLEPGGAVDHPEELDLRRVGNRHTAFGSGVHRCLGSHLARLELRVALSEFHRQIPDYRLAPGTELTYSMGIRSIESLPLEFEPQSTLLSIRPDPGA